LASDSRRAAHIALVLHDFSGGGSERIAIRLAQRWAAAGRRVTIVAGTQAGVARPLAEGLAVVEFRHGLTRRGAACDQNIDEVRSAPEVSHAVHAFLIG
jgi:NAD(P)-dependent dehydrogenase (short-subunit alcohol dehydrogenase family)